MNRSVVALIAIGVLGTGLGGAHAGPDKHTPAPAPTPPPAPDGAGGRSQPKPADDRRIVGILDIRVDGVPDEVKESFQGALEQQLDSKHYWLAGRSRIKQMMMSSTKWTEGCLVGACLGEIRAQTGAELVLLAALTGSGTSFGYVVTLVRTDTGRVLQQESDRCDVCTVNEAVTKATLATIGLLNNVPEKLPDEAAEQGASVDVAVGRVQTELVAHQKHTSRVGIVLTVLGLVAAATGITLYVTQSRPDWAFATAIGGGGMTASGVVVLTF